MDKNKTFWAFSEPHEKAVDLYIYSDVTAYSADGAVSANEFKDALANAGDVDRINIYINSNGGDVKEGISIYSQLIRHQARKIVYIDGFACSIASVIAMAGDVVHISNCSSLIIHNAMSLAYGNAEQMRHEADMLDVITENIKNAYLDKADGKITHEKITELMDKESVLSPEDCLQYGLVDVIDKKTSNPDGAGMQNQMPKNMPEQVANMVCNRMFEFLSM